MILEKRSQQAILIKILNRNRKVFWIYVLEAFSIWLLIIKMNMIWKWVNIMIMKMMRKNVLKTFSYKIWMMIFKEVRKWFFSLVMKYNLKWNCKYV